MVRKIFGFNSKDSHVKVAKFLAETLPDDEQNKFSVVYGEAHTAQDHIIVTYSSFIANELELYCIFHNIPYTEYKHEVNTNADRIF